MCFSGGKDSLLALQALQTDSQYEVTDLITTVTDAYDRVSMHGTRRSLLRIQGASIGLPVTEVVVPPGSTNAVYEEKWDRRSRKCRAKVFEKSRLETSSWRTCAPTEKTKPRHLG